MTDTHVKVYQDTLFSSAKAHGLDVEDPRVKGALNNALQSITCWVRWAKEAITEAMEALPHDSRGTFLGAQVAGVLSPEMRVVQAHLERALVELDGMAPSVTQVSTRCQHYYDRRRCTKPAGHESYDAAHAWELHGRLSCRESTLPVPSPAERVEAIFAALTPEDAEALYERIKLAFGGKAGE